MSTPNIVLLSTLLLVACASPNHAPQPGGDGGVLGGEDPDAEKPDKIGGGGGGPACAPCVGSCVPDTVRPAGVSDGRFVVVDGALFRSGPRVQGGYSSNELFFGALTGADRKPDVQMGEASFEIIPAPGHVLLVDRTMQTSSIDQSVVLLDADGAPRVRADVPGDVLATREFAASKTALFRLEPVSHPGIGPATTDVYVHPLGQGTWTRIREGKDSYFNQLVADDRGAYYTRDRSTLEHTDETGKSRTLVRLGGGAVLDDALILGADSIYVGGGSATVSRRTCESSPTLKARSLVRRVRRDGGAMETLADLDVTPEMPALSLVAGDDTSLVFKSMWGCRSEGGLFIMPADGSTPPRRLLAKSEIGKPPIQDVRIVGDQVYFARTEDGPIQRTCRRLE